MFQHQQINKKSIQYKFDIYYLEEICNANTICVGLCETFIAIKYTIKYTIKYLEIQTNIH